MLVFAIRCFLQAWQTRRKKDCDRESRHRTLHISLASSPSDSLQPLCHSTFPFISFQLRLLKFQNLSKPIHRI